MAGILQTTQRRESGDLKGFKTQVHAQECLVFQANRGFETPHASWSSGFDVRLDER